MIYDASIKIITKIIMMITTYFLRLHIMIIIICINHQNQNHDDLLLSCILPVSPRVGEAELYPDSQDTRWNSLFIRIITMTV